VGLQTEFGFTLPKGYVGHDGTLHRRGVMRLSTARDEIEPLRDPRITGPDDPYLTILVIARVITELGTLDHVGDGEVEGLFAADLAFLQDLYGIINFGDPADAAALQRAVLPVGYDDNDTVDNDTVENDSVVEATAIDVDSAPTESDTTTRRQPEASTSKRRSRIEEVTPHRTP